MCCRPLASSQEIRIRDGREHLTNDNKASSLWPPPPLPPPIVVALINNLIPFEQVKSAPRRTGNQLPVRDS